MKEQEKRTQTEEFKAAAAEKRQPLCVDCGEPLIVSQYQPTYAYWTWREDIHHYVISTDDGDADRPACAGCGAGSWGLIESSKDTIELGLHY